MQLKERFTAEHAAVLTEFAGIGSKAVFQDEGDGVTVAQIFGALQAEARAAVVAVDHFKRFGRTGAVVQVGVAQAEVHDTVDFNIGSGGCGADHGGGHGDGDLFHSFSPYE